MWFETAEAEMPLKKERLKWNYWNNQHSVLHLAKSACALRCRYWDYESTLKTLQRAAVFSAILKSW